MALTALRQLHQRDARVLSASRRGSMTLTGSLPSGDAVPAAIRSRPLSTTSEWTYADRLVSPPPEEERRNPVPPLVALFLLVGVGGATGAPPAGPSAAAEPSRGPAPTKDEVLFQVPGPAPSAER